MDPGWGRYSLFRGVQGTGQQHGQYQGAGASTVVQLWWLCRHVEQGLVDKVCRFGRQAAPGVDHADKAC